MHAVKYKKKKKKSNTWLHRIARTEIHTVNSLGTIEHARIAIKIKIE